MLENWYIYIYTYIVLDCPYLLLERLFELVILTSKDSPVQVVPSSRLPPGVTCHPALPWSEVWSEYTEKVIKKDLTLQAKKELLVSSKANRVRDVSSFVRTCEGVAQSALSSHCLRSKQLLLILPFKSGYSTALFIQAITFIQRSRNVTGILCMVKPARLPESAHMVLEV